MLVESAQLTKRAHREVPPSPCGTVPFPGNRRGHVRCNSFCLLVPKGSHCAVCFLLSVWLCACEQDFLLLHQVFCPFCHVPGLNGALV